MHRAYLTIPGVFKGEELRFVYTVIGFQARGEWDKVGPTLVCAMHDFLTALSHRLFREEMVADCTLPLIIERRAMEYSEQPAIEAGHDFDTDTIIEARRARCSLSGRIAVPGVPNLGELTNGVCPDGVPRKIGFVSELA